MPQLCFPFSNSGICRVFSLRPSGFVIRPAHFRQESPQRRRNSRSHSTTPLFCADVRACAKRGGLVNSAGECRPAELTRLSPPAYLGGRSRLPSPGSGSARALEYRNVAREQERAFTHAHLNEAWSFSRQLRLPPPFRLNPPPMFKGLEPFSSQLLFKN